MKKINTLHKNSKAFNITIIDDSLNTKHKLIIVDNYDIILNINELLSCTYEEGDIVKVELKFFSGPRVGILVDGEEVPIKYEEEWTGQLHEFVMPNHDVVIRTTFNDFVSVDNINFSDIPVTPDGFKKEQIVKLTLNSKLSGNVYYENEFPDYLYVLNLMDREYFNTIESSSQFSDNSVYTFTFLTGNQAKMCVNNDYIYICVIDENFQETYYRSVKKLETKVNLKDIYQEINDLDSSKIVKVQRTTGNNILFTSPDIFIVEDSEVIKKIIEAVKNCSAYLDIEYLPKLGASAVSFMFVNKDGTTVQFGFNSNYVSYNGFKYLIDLNLNEFFTEDTHVKKAYYEGKEIANNTIFITLKEESNKVLMKDDFPNIELVSLKRIPNSQRYEIVLKDYDMFHISEAIQLINSLQLEFIDSVEPYYYQDYLFMSINPINLN